MRLTRQLLDNINQHNMLLAVGPDGRRSLKLADFGGTPLYMAPEQVTSFRDVKPPDERWRRSRTNAFLT
ncbi:MAG: hypothetical protein U0746_00760 [Gemmataceae bacterium]